MRKDAVQFNSVALRNGFRMKHFSDLRKHEREQLIKSGIVREVAEQLGVSKATVSRTFNDEYKNPNPVIVAALRRAVEASRHDSY